ncbi:MAG: hypothetical protein ABL964_11685 [Steroidobacteraceae bacterium]
MRIFIAVVAGALLGVSAMAGKPDAQTDPFQQSGTATGAAAFGTSGVEAILPVVDALRSGDVVYSGTNRASREDYVPPRPPL